MNFDEVIGRINQCGDRDVSAAIIDALRTLLDEDEYLFQNDVHERTIGACLAWYLKPHFPGWHVDPEYNKHGSDPKKVAWRAHGRRSIVVPDIIVHHRGPEGPNLLVIQIKKSSNDETSGDDMAKLRGMRADLDYAHALFVRFGVGQDAGRLTACDWA
jgi:hypothetical protein